MFSASPHESPHRLRRRLSQNVAYFQGNDEDLLNEDSGYDAEDSLEAAAKSSGNPSVASPGSLESSLGHDERRASSLLENAEPVPRKRAKHACDYCRTKMQGTNLAKSEG